MVRRSRGGRGSARGGRGSARGGTEGGTRGTRGGSGIRGGVRGARGGGARAARGGGARGGARGGNVLSGLGADRAVSVQNFDIANITNYPTGPPVEKPLHPKRRRLWHPDEEDFYTAPLSPNHPAPANSNDVTVHRNVGPREHQALGEGTSSQDRIPEKRISPTPDLHQVVQPSLIGAGVDGGSTEPDADLFCDTVSTFEIAWDDAAVSSPAAFETIQKPSELESQSEYDEIHITPPALDAPDQAGQPTSYGAGVNKDNQTKAMSLGTPDRRSMWIPKDHRDYTVPPRDTPPPSQLRSIPRNDEAVRGTDTPRDGPTALRKGTSSRGTASPMPDPRQSVQPSPIGAQAEQKSLGTQAEHRVQKKAAPAKHRKLKDDEIQELINRGSEDESDSEDEDAVCSDLYNIPRTCRLFIDTYDDDPEPEAGSAVHDVRPPMRDDSSPVRNAGSPMHGPEPQLPGELLRDPSPCEQILGERQEGPEQFLFDWVAMGPDYMCETNRRETFNSGRCGPVRPFMSPYDSFMAIWTREIMDYIAAQTNKYAQELADLMWHQGVIKPTSRVTKWVDTNADELYMVLAIDIATGILVQPILEDYWNTNGDLFTTPGFRVHISYNRYNLLKRCLHFNGNKNMLPTLSKSEAKLYKIMPIVDHLNKMFTTLYVMDRNIALDESLTQWKGWLSINQFIRNKAAAIGIKTYEICESKTGYLHKFEVYAGHENVSTSDSGPISGIIPSLVLRLLRGLENQGYCVWMDNFYNSPALARTLKCKGFDCVGTLRTNRQFVPTEIKDLKKTDMAVGDLVGVTSGDVDILVWRDKNKVAMISTYHGNTVSVAENGILKPNLIRDYNVSMGGVDKKDQMLASYPMERKKTSVWYKKFFRRLLNVSVLNAFILYKSTPGTTPLSHRTFRKDLVRAILDKHAEAAKTDRLQVHRPSAPPPPARIPLITPVNMGDHFPVQNDLMQSAKSRRLLRKCAHCGKLTTSNCPGCKVALCVFTCFKPFHFP